MLSCTYRYTNKIYAHFIYIACSTRVEQVLDEAPHKAAAVRPPTTHHENYPS